MDAQEDGAADGGAEGAVVRLRDVYKPKIAKTMGEFKRGSLRSGSKTGPKVTNRKQAIAIALNQAKKPNTIGSARG